MRGSASTPLVATTGDEVLAALRAYDTATRAGDIDGQVACREAHLSLVAGDLSAPILGLAMIQGSVCLPPSPLAAICLLSTHQQVRAGTRDTVEQSVIGGADSTSEVCLSGTTSSLLTD